MSALDIRDLIKDKEAMKALQQPNLFKTQNRSFVLLDKMYGSRVEIGSSGFIVPTVNIQEIDADEYQLGQLFRDGDSGDIYMINYRPNYFPVNRPGTGDIYLEYVDGVGLLFKTKVGEDEI